MQNRRGRCRRVNICRQGNHRRRGAGANTVVGADAVVIGGVRGKTGDCTRGDSANIEIVIAGYKSAERTARRNVETIASGTRGRSPVGGKAAGANTCGGSGEGRSERAGTTR